MQQNANRSVHLSRWVEFSSAHLYRQDKWSKEENIKTFGACYSEYGHGHNYRLEIILEGKIDSESGIVVNLIETETYLKELVKPFDHHHLNFDLIEFRDKVPTTENIACYFWKVIQQDFSQKPYRAVLLRLYETDNLWVEVQ